MKKISKKTVRKQGENNRKTVRKQEEINRKTVRKPSENNRKTVRNPSENSKKTVGKQSENSRKTFAYVVEVRPCTCTCTCTVLCTLYLRFPCQVQISTFWSQIIYKNNDFRDKNSGKFQFFLN